LGSNGSQRTVLQLRADLGSNDIKSDHRTYRYAHRVTSPTGKRSPGARGEDVHVHCLQLKLCCELANPGTIDDAPRGASFVRSSPALSLALTRLYITHIINRRWVPLSLQQTSRSTLGLLYYTITWSVQTTDFYSARLQTRWRCTRLSKCWTTTTSPSPCW
jgi:hypothetical protein